jgi:disulfide bond formation protein DsbB
MNGYLVILSFLLMCIGCFSQAVFGLFWSLLALDSGALGIAIGGVLWNYQFHPDLGLDFALITGFFSRLFSLVGPPAQCEFS